MANLLKEELEKKVYPVNWDLIDFENGEVKCYHYSDKSFDDYVKKSGQRGLQSRYEFKEWGRSRSFFYLTEGGISKDKGISNRYKYISYIPINEIYDINKNSNNYDKSGSWENLYKQTSEDGYSAWVYNLGGYENVPILTSFKDVPISEKYTMLKSGMYKLEGEELEDEVVGSSQPGSNDEYIDCLEIHANIDLPGFEDPNGIKLPYIVHMTSEGIILSIRRNYDQDDALRKKKMYFTHYTMIPGLGFYGYGYIHLIGGLTKTATSSMRQLIDAGTFANLPGGFKAHGLRVLAPDEPIAPGEFREVNAPAGDLGKSLQILPFKEPSSTLFNLMDYASKLAQQFADSTDNIVENASNYGPVGTTMALLEQSSKLFNAVHKRLHAAQTKDLRILTRLDSEYLPDLYPYEVAGGAQQVFRKDFNLKSIDVIPVSDPNMPTEAHRIAKINAIMSIAQQNPAAYNMEQIGMELFAAMGVEEPQRYLKQQQQPFSADPISENMAALKGAPLQARQEQNHDAHIVAHGMFLQNPSYQSPGVQQVLTSHLQDHLAMKYKQEMAQMINDPQMQQVIMSGQQLPPEMENQIALLAANASDKVLKLDEEKSRIMAGETKDTAQEQIEIQRQDLALRAQKLMNDMKVHQDKMDLEESKLMIDDENKDEDRKLKEAKLAMDSAKDTMQEVQAVINTTIGRQG